MRRALGRLIVALGRCVVAAGHAVMPKPTVYGINIASGDELRQMGAVVGVCPETDEQYRSRVHRAVTVRP